MLEASVIALQAIPVYLYLNIGTYLSLLLGICCDYWFAYYYAERKKKENSDDE